MSQYPRYAIYFVPDATDALYRFGAHLLGYDAFTGNALSFTPGVEAQIENWQHVTADPRKYGFHATLKAPISLVSGARENELIEAIGAFASTPRKIPVINPVARSIGSFIAIVPDHPSTELQEFASDCVTAFDCFRAPLTASDRARRNVSTLTTRQIEYLDRWGYPYVFEEFSFHMTLTGAMPAEQREAVLNVLQSRFADLKIASVPINRIALFRQNDEKSNFWIIEHRPLPAR